MDNYRRALRLCGVDIMPLSSKRSLPQLATSPSRFLAPLKTPCGRQALLRVRTCSCGSGKESEVILLLPTLIHWDQAGELRYFDPRTRR